jgi:hypothetical protein
MPLDNQASQFWEAINQRHDEIMRDLELELEMIEVDFRGGTPEPDLEKGQ